MEKHHDATGMQARQLWAREPSPIISFFVGTLAIGIYFATAAAYALATVPEIGLLQYVIAILGAAAICWLVMDAGYNRTKRRELATRYYLMTGEKP